MIAVFFSNLGELYNFPVTCFLWRIKITASEIILVYRTTFHFLEKSASRIAVNSTGSSVIYVKVYIHKECLTSLFQG